MADARRPRKSEAAPRAADEVRQPLSAEELRRQAEEHLDGLSAAASAAAADSTMPEELAAAVHELRVHQIELEMQNEELRRAQLELDARRDKYFELFDLAPVGYLTLSDKGIVGDANFTAAHLLGDERQQLVGQPFSAFVCAPDRDVYYLHLRKLEKSGAPQTCELRLQPVGGEPFWAHLESHPQGSSGGEPLRCQLTFADVHKRVLAEKAVREASIYSRNLIETSLDPLVTISADGRITDVNTATEKITGKSRETLIDSDFADYFTEPEMARAGYLEAFSAGQVVDYPLAIRHSSGAITEVLYNASVYRDEHGAVLGVFAAARDITERKEAEQNALLYAQVQIELNERKQAEEALARSAHELREQLHDMVKTMGAIVGLRDPYTAAHERRVTALAAAIALELGLDEEAREGLAFAAEVHDVGKIGVPAEILSKPAALTDMEYALIKQHPQAGRELLAAIRFRQPVAEIVGQHQERLDGSGYPAGLKGDEIMLEARILAVADVVEAMASHRPYRAALGLEAALAEVRGGAGVRYDASAVAACERVFAQGFVFPEP